MIANSKKFQLMFLARNKNVEKETVYAGKTKWSLNANQLLCITVDTNINFKSNNENICCKAINKIGTLFWVISFFILWAWCGIYVMM